MSKIATEIEPCARWTNDCQGKQDYDGRLISISTRYWPATGGFWIFQKQEDGTVQEVEPPPRLPSAKASIVVNHGEPDEYGYGEYFDLAEQSFEAETEGEVKAQVEAWVKEQANRVVVALRREFEP